MSDQAPHGKGCNVVIEPSMKQACQIDAQKVFSTFPENFEINLINHNLQLNIDVEDIEVKLDKLILYETGGHFKPIFISSQISINNIAVVII